MKTVTWSFQLIWKASMRINQCFPLHSPSPVAAWEACKELLLHWPEGYRTCWEEFLSLVCVQWGVKQWSEDIPVIYPWLWRELKGSLLHYSVKSMWQAPGELKSRWSFRTLKHIKLRWWYVWILVFKRFSFKIGTHRSHLVRGGWRSFLP